ncbi:MAG: exonuclease domain-containing protein [Lachnospiraceae bacterium]|nr:exonuclease domain-containing protein [Lachnospiraceae bacterium]
MNYIVLDLEWNQSDTGKEPEVKALPFEIIDIGAVKLDSERKMAGEFNRLVRPTVYRHMHKITGKIIHLHMRDLQSEEPFPRIMEEFRSWCGQDYIFCTWGPLDLYELQRNMRFYRMEPLSGVPIRFLDVQKLFSIAFEDKKSRRSLEHAIDYLKIEKDIPFHRAYSDAYYTARIFSLLPQELFANYSIDTFVVPASRDDEVRVLFGDYMKYISREFEDKQKAMEDREVISTKCYLCHRNIRKKIRWFTPNGKHYYSVAVCPVHGFMKSKIRIRKSENDKVYVVKTSKFISEEDCAKLQNRRESAKEHRRTRKKGGGPKK